MPETNSLPQNIRFEELLLRAFEKFSTELCVAYPARILSYDDSIGQAKVQVLIQRIYRKGKTFTNFPALSKVPVIFPQGQWGFIKFPLSAGDLVLLIFADRSLDSWLNGTGQATPPFDIRQHHISDAIAIPGLYPSQNTNQQTKIGAVEINLKGSTKIAIINSTGELIDLFCQAINYVVTTITFNNGGGSTGPPTNATILNNILTSIQSFKA